MLLYRRYPDQRINRKEKSSTLVKRKEFYSGKKKRHTVKTQTTQQERADTPYKQER